MTMVASLPPTLSTFTLPVKATVPDSRLMFAIARLPEIVALVSPSESVVIVAPVSS